MPNWVRARVTRVLDDMHLFQRIENGDIRVPEEIREKDSSVVGVYNYDSADESRTVWITERSIWWFNESWQEVPYGSIEKIVLPREKLGDDDCLRVFTTDNDSHAVPIVGRYGRCRDIFEFSRFLRRTVDDLKRVAGEAANQGNDQE